MSHIIFIDFSTSSTAICKYNIKNKIYEYFLLLNHYHFTKSDNGKPMDTISLAPFKNSPLVIHFYKKKSFPRPKGNPSEFCRHMLKSCYDMSNAFDSLMDIVLCDVNLEDSIFGIEDYAVGIKTNNQIENTEMVSSCKNKLYARLLMNRIYFFQPQEIKKITGNGNAKKGDMLIHFMKKDISNVVHKIIASNRKIFELSGGKVKKPVEDLVDSFYGVHVVRSVFSI